MQEVYNNNDRYLFKRARAGTCATACCIQTFRGSTTDIFHTTDVANNTHNLDLTFNIYRAIPWKEGNAQYGPWFGQGCLKERIQITIAKERTDGLGNYLDKDLDYRSISFENWARGLLRDMISANQSHSSLVSLALYAGGYIACRAKTRKVILTLFPTCVRQWHPDLGHTRHHTGWKYAHGLPVPLARRSCITEA